MALEVCAPARFQVDARGTAVARTDEPQALKRILFVDHTAALGGGELALLELVGELDRSRYEPVVVLCSHGPLVDRLRSAGVQTYTLPLAPSVAGIRKDALHPRALLRITDELRMLAFVARLSKLIRRLHVDVVHTNSLKADVIGGLAARLAGVPVLWHVRDRIDCDYLPGLAVKVFRALCGRIPAFVIANSDATLQTVRSHCEDHCATVYSGVGVTEQPRAARRRPAANRELQDGPVIGMVGRISPWKGQDVFLRAASRIHERHPDTCFRIIGGAIFGEDGYERDIRSLCTNLGLDGCVEFTGFRSDVRNAIQDLDILVHASVVPEPFGRVVVEGMLAGKPVVATDGGGVREIVVDGKTGRLVPMGDDATMAEAISRLISQPQAARQMGRAARCRALRLFTARTTTRKVEEIYERLTEDRARQVRQPVRSMA